MNSFNRYLAPSSESFGHGQEGIERAFSLNPSETGRQVNLSTTKMLERSEVPRSTRIEDASILCSPQHAKVDDNLAITVSYRLTGPIRRNFSRDLWEKAYDEHDAGLLMIYWVDLLRKRPVLSKPLKSDKFKRRGVFFWTRNPEIPHRVWMTVATEFDTVLYPKTEVEAQDMLFNVTRAFEMPAASLGKGRHDLTAKVRAKWGRHVFTEKGRASGHTGSPVTVTVE